jgi:hydrogenase maturation factor
MVNNSTNINKTTTSPQIIEHKKTMKQMALEIQVQTLDGHTKVVGSNRLMTFQPSTLF